MQPREDSLGWLDLSAIRSGHSFCEFGNVILGKIEGRRLPQHDHDLGTVRQRRFELYATISNAPTNDIHERRIARGSPPGADTS